MDKLGSFSEHYSELAIKALTYIALYKAAKKHTDNCDECRDAESIYALCEEGHSATEASFVAHSILVGEHGT